MTKKKLFVGFIVAAIAALGAVGIKSEAKAASNLSDLFVLGSLFNGNNGAGILNNSNGIDLGNLFVLDQLFGTTGSSVSTGLFGASKGGTSNLGDLIILNQIFGGNAGFLGVSGGNNLGRLFVLDHLFGGTSGTNLFTTTPTTVTKPKAATTTPATTTPATTTTPIPVPAAPTQATSVGVSIHNLAFDPLAVNIPVKGMVTWINNDTVQHTVTADDGSFSSVILNPGQSYSHIFNQAGRFPYHCSIHTFMTGAVTVQ